MALVNREEFAALCGKERNYINTYIGRGKIMLTDLKQIDTDNPVNKLFKKNCLNLAKKSALVEKQAKKQPTKQEISDTYEQVVEKVEAIPVKVYSKTETTEQTTKRKKQYVEDQDSVNWDARKKKADALKAERGAELAQLQVEKMMGNLMPVDLVEMILKVNIQDIFKTFENELINLGSIYCDILAGGDREKLAEIVTKLRLKLSETIKRIESTAAQEIDNVVEDYAEVRNRGERK